MPTVTVTAPITDHEGHCAWYWIGTHGGRHYTDYAAHPADSFDDRQPPFVDVRIGHDGPTIGTVVHLDHRGRMLDAVAVIDVHPDEVDNLSAMYFSAGVLELTPAGSVVAERCKVDHIAIVTSTAGIGMTPLVVWPSDLRDSGARMRWHHRTPKLELLRRAATAYDQRHRGDPLIIDRGDEYRHGDTPPPGHGPIEHGPPGRILRVY